jgi:hypothetical protein
MCTLSWSADAHGYELYFSRDERRSRPRAEPPRERCAGGVRFLAPRDPEGGGAWLAANEHGVALALLNRYDASTPPQEPLASRGGVVLALAGARGPDQAERWLRALPLVRHAPFDLAVFAPDGRVRRLGWDGRALERDPDARGPLASSAVAAPEARAWRSARSAHLRGEAFHRDHVAARPELATCMHRADAETVSLSRVRVTRSRVAFAYAPDAPCRAALGPELELRRG